MSSLSQNQWTSSTQSNKRRLQRSSDDETGPSKISNNDFSNFVKFIVLTSQTEKPNQNFGNYDPKNYSVLQKMIKKYLE